MEFLKHIMVDLEIIGITQIQKDFYSISTLDSVVKLK